MVCRDYSMGRETPYIPVEVARLAELNAFHCTACVVYANRNHVEGAGAGDINFFRYSLGHRGIVPMAGHEKIAEFEFVSTQ